MKAFLAVILAGLTGFSTVFAAEEKTQTYEVRGVVREIRTANREVVVDHEDIPGYMSAMTMPFSVRELKEMDGVKPGDLVSFRLNVTAKEGWIDQLQRRGETPKELAKDPTRMEAAKVGDSFPAFSLTNEAGKTIEFANYQGQAVAVTFIFTRCPFPNFCPRLSNNFAETQNLLTNHPDGPANWQFLSVSIDPEHDTPEVLRQYGERLHADPARWHFATGKLREITVLALKCGLGFWEENGTITHDLRTIVVGGDGRIRRIFTDNNWKPAELADEIRAAARVK